MTPSSGRLLIHLAPDRVRVIDLSEVYYLEAEGELTLVRTRSARRIRDVRRMGEVLGALAEQALVRIHGDHAVNLDRIREIRLAWVESGARTSPPRPGGR